MIAAKKSRAFESLFYIYNRWLLRRSFQQILLTQDAHQPDRGTGGIYMINHSSWWDALILFYLNKTVMHVDAVAMMGADGLRRFPFFRKLGAFSIDPSSRRDIKASLLYAKEQLAAGKSLFFFPQGAETHLEKRPLLFFPGVTYLHEAVPEAPLIPVVFYHGLFHHQLPEWYIHIGEPIIPDKSLSRREKTRYLERETARLLDSLKAQVVNEKRGSFTQILRGRRGIGQTWEELKTSVRRWP